MPFLSAFVSDDYDWFLLDILEHFMDIHFTLRVLKFLKLKKKILNYTLRFPQAITEPFSVKAAEKLAPAVT